MLIKNTQCIHTVNNYNLWL